jgi:FAD/FMN-containing dehydrogenase
MFPDNRVWGTRRKNMVSPIEELNKILGPGNVLDDARILESYSKDESFAQALRPRFVAKAQNAAQIQELVQWANWTMTPLVPVSSGPPHFRGDTVPSAPGAVIVDLSGMNKIVHVNERNRMVLIEPGVTFAQLQPEMARHGMRVSSPLAPRANKSVISALLEREPVTIPKYQWTLLDPLRCTEVVWGDGQRMTTGEAGSSESLKEEWERNLAQVIPTGPGQTNFYKFTSAAQGSMGIVTWASIKCEVLPRIHKLYFAPASRLEDLLDLTYSILRIRFGDELLIMNNWNLAMLLGKTADRIAALADKLPRWNLMVGIAGRERLPEEKVAYQEKDLSEMAQKYGLQLVPAAPGADGVEALKAILVSCAEPYWKLAYKGSCQDLFFLNTLDRSPEFVKTMYAVAQAQGYPTSEIGVYIQPVQQGASCHIEFSLPFDPGSPAEAGRMRKFYVKASEEMLKQGAYYSRPYGIWSPLAFNRDAQTTIALRKIKQIFDPNNILNPGKLCF